jgi:hypothetical protein
MIWAKALGGLNTILQTVFITLKLTGQVPWPWLTVMAPTLVPIFLLGLGALWLILQLLTHEK